MKQPAAPKRAGAKAGPADGSATGSSVEPMVIALAERLGTFLGRVQKKADGWLENEALRDQVSQIRDGAAELLQHVNRASESARKKPKSKAAAKTRNASAVADAPVKRLRKPPPQELFDPRLGEPMGKQMGQKNLKRRPRG